MKYLQIAQPIIAILLIVSILLQNRESGLSGVFGGGGTVFRTKRGLEKILFIATIVLVVIFIGISLASLVFGTQSA
ncbi:MAG: preprotein translocase subunit SecG [Patescibacteria group bacterium]|jgi:preprotein translocase subunit SecG